MTSDAILVLTNQPEGGKLIREAAVLGGMDITYRGRVIAEIVPKREPPIVSFFSRQKLSPGFRRLQASGKLARGTDSTTAISEDREDRV